MSKIATVLKEEITRLARKEIHVETAKTRKASAQHRRDIAELKRRAGALQKQVAYLEKQERKRSATAAPEQSADGRRFSARGLKTHRNKLGLSAAEYALLVGSSAQTIYNWEQGKSRPQGQRLATLVSLRGLGKREAWERLDLLED